MRRTIVFTGWLAIFGGLFASAANGQYEEARGLVGQTFRADQIRPANGPVSPDYGFPSPQTSESNGSWLDTLKAPFQSGPKPLSIQAPKPTPNDPIRLNNIPTQINDDVYLAGAQLAVSRQLWDKAIEQYGAVLQRKPNHLGALIGVARVHNQRGDFQASYKAYIAAIQAHPMQASVHNDFGMCCARYGQMPIALQAFQTAVRLAPQEARYRNNLAKGLIHSNRSAEALEQLLTVQAPGVANYNCAYMLREAGQTAKAQFHAQQALQFDPNLNDARLLLQAMNPQRPATPVSRGPAVGASRQPSTRTAVTPPLNAGPLTAGPQHARPQNSRFTSPGAPPNGVSGVPTNPIGLQRGVVAPNAAPVQSQFAPQSTAPSRPAPAFRPGTTGGYQPQRLPPIGQRIQPSGVNTPRTSQRQIYLPRVAPRY